MRLVKALLALLIVASLLCPPARAAEQGMTHEYCGTNIPPDQATGFVALPEGDVFCPLLADPKAPHSYISYIRGSSTSAFGTDLLSVGIADHFGMARWNGPRPGEGFQIRLEGAVFAQFDLRSQSYDLINADYIFGIPMTYRWRDLSARLRVYHQSSHLGDEFVLRTRVPRENFSFESSEGILSYDAGPLRLYGGGEYLIHSEPHRLLSWQVHGGAELRQREGALYRGKVTSVRLVAGGDVKAVQYIDWEPQYSGVAGFEFSDTRATMHAARHWSVLGHYYYGPSPYSQFFRSDVTYYGVGVHFAL